MFSLLEGYLNRADENVNFSTPILKRKPLVIRQRSNQTQPGLCTRSQSGGKGSQATAALSKYPSGPGQETAFPSSR
jgi:hypothetical protein